MPDTLPIPGSLQELITQQEWDSLALHRISRPEERDEIISDLIQFLPLADDDEDRKQVLKIARHYADNYAEDFDSEGYGESEVLSAEHSSTAMVHEPPPAKD